MAIASEDRKAIIEAVDELMIAAGIYDNLAARFMNEDLRTHAQRASLLATIDNHGNRVEPKLQFDSSRCDALTARAAECRRIAAALRTMPT